MCVCVSVWHQPEFPSKYTENFAAKEILMASIIDPGIPTSVEVCDEELSCGGP